MSAPVQITEGRLMFDPSALQLPAKCHEFAQSPQTLVYDNFVRIFFSSRQMDGTKFLSHVLFADFALDLTTLIRVAEEPIIPLGAIGTFDEHGIFPMNVIRVGKLIYGFTTGWSRRSSVSVETSIGVTVSHDDGRTFQRLGPGPILSSSLNEPFLVGDGFVKKINDVFHMWYIFGTAWRQFEKGSQPDRIYKIGYATSLDGLNWTRSGHPIIEDRLGPEESQALPTVIERNGIYHMIFCFRFSTDFRKNPARGYRLGYAWSKNLKQWHRDDDLISFSPTSWDSEMQCYPHLFELKNQVYLLYNGNNFGRFGFGIAKTNL